MNIKGYNMTELIKFIKAFEKWEIEYRDNPDTFMNDAQIESKNPKDLAEIRAIYFINLIKAFENLGD